MAELPALPSAILQLLEPVDPEGLSPDTLRGVVEADPPLARRVLAAINSPAFGFGASVQSIHRAAALVPFEAFRDLVFTLAVHESLFAPFRSSNPDRQRAWLHCLAVAAASREIARETRRADPWLAFASGLLHAVGRALFARGDERRYEAFLRSVESSEGDPIDEEIAAFGLGHAEAGGQAARRWGLPGAVADAIAGHHPFSGDAVPDPLAAIVHVADFLAWAGGLGSLLRRRRPVLHVATAASIGFDTLDKGRVRSAIDREVGLGAKALDLAVPDPNRIREALEDTSLELSLAETKYRETRRLLARRGLEIAAVAEAIARARASGETNVVVREVLGAIHAGLGFDRVFLFLPDPERRCLRGRLLAGVRTPPVEAARLEVPIDPSVDPCLVSFARAAHGQGPLRVGVHERLESDWLAGLGIEEMGLVPIEVDGEVVGVVGVDQVAGRQRIEESRLESLRVLAQETGLILEKARLAQKNRELSILDELTEVANPRRLREFLDHEFERARRYARPLSIALVDLDRLDAFRQVHGRNASDEVLRHLGRLLDQLSRQTDFVGRHAGGPFALVLPETGTADAVQFAERIRRAFETGAARIAIRFPGPPLTLSLGLAGWSTDVPSADDLLRRAEHALGRARAEGGNRAALTE